MKKFLLLIVIFVLAGIAYFFVYLDVNKKEIRKVPHDHSADLANEMGRKKTNMERDIYVELDPPSYKISNKEIANFIYAAWKLSPWIKNPNRIFYNKDSIKWNYILFGLDTKNPTFKVAYGHSMWVTAEEILRYNNYSGYSSVATGKIEKNKKPIFFKPKPDMIRDRGRTDSSGKYRPFRTKDQKDQDLIVLAEQQRLADIQAKNLYADEYNKKVLKVLIPLIFFVPMLAALFFKFLFLWFGNKK
ncbi:TPA: hypothetical protein DEP30_03620 [Candidatus Nomurabacteria bacterium]|nr:MAG: hypothetical protein UR97_C0009G0017 [Candidatus Nomurabacteria bacterium GW2011_GWE2_36_115]KKP93394.1 MAG: hypothetical protein US00_C0007G0016 [Candidatus Nomurabacteria bacterium GW2011_GWF2_36_126]KKP96514.1 MAG: hypothetical protein US04_C0001G0016 [Candidatus Nomurabacteria bacterium GW2011_GWD2_36_14]KKP99882.1 MAG: hypothetical protein US08_C0001G0565 [Candidatus Nomurabacteria bacterium GW2011_GWF2_36_19]KKQ04993.1 MAG: hypothetical protein US17_C0009G0016 [Candidatus Nomuraba